MEWIILNKKIFIGISILIIFLVTLSILSSYVKWNRLETKNEQEIQALHKTPAAEYCENNWWTLQILTNKSDEIYWICNFKDWSSCEVLEYFRWECLSTSEENEDDASYCSNWTTCEYEENDIEESEDLSSWIEDMNNMENINGEIIESDDLDDIDIDSLYDYYENEFSNTWNRNREQPMENLEWWENIENQLSSKCNRVWWEILGKKCYLSNWIEIAF